MTVKPIYFALFGHFLFAALPLLQAQSSTTVRQFIGVNLNAQDDVDKARRFSHLREFHSWADDISLDVNSTTCPFEPGNDQKLRWNPSYNQARYIRYDDFYQALPQKVSVVMQGAAPSMVGGGFTNEVKDAKPICRGGSPYGSFNTIGFHLDPVAYKEHAIWQSLFAARYGAAPVGGFPTNFQNLAANYLVAPDNTGLGRGLVRYMEDFNEQDAAWHSSDNINTNATDASAAAPPGQVTTYFFRPEEYAAMLSADYDGNCQSDSFRIPSTTNGFWGIKNLSPETQVVMSGTADLRQDYIKDVITACHNLRDNKCGTLPFDVLNMHHYPTTAHPAIGNTPEYNKFLNGVAFFGGGEGTNPEAPNEMLKQRISSTLHDGPGLSIGTTKLWITELGYDSHGGTAVSVPAVWPFDRQTVQGQWLTRCVFEVLASGSVERLYLYHLEDKPGTGLFTHTGILDQFGKPKKSWYHLMTQISVLGDYNYVETANDDATRTKFFNGQDPTNPGPPLPYDEPRIYKFLTGGVTDQPVFALWAPFKSNVTYPGMLFIPELQVTKALKIEVQDLDESGKRTLIPPDDLYYDVTLKGTFIKNLTITETPQYIKLNNNKDMSDPVAQPVNHLSVSSLCCDAARLYWDAPTAGTEVSPGLVLSRYYQVYYAPVSDFDPDLPTFDLSKLITVEERLSGTFTECIVTGLTPGVQYYFFVVPVRNVIANGVPVQGVLPVLSGTLTAGQHYVQGAITGCGTTTTGCLLAVEEEGTIIAPFGLEAVVNQTFGVGMTSAQKCAELATVPTGGINMDQNGPLTLTFGVSFKEPKFLKNIYFSHASGGPGKLKIEIIEDCCDQWKLVKELDINGYNNWFGIANNQLGQRRIEKIRFTITREVRSNLLLPRVYFCAMPAPDLCRLGTTQSGILSSPSDLSVKDIDTRSATISWTPGMDKDLPAARYLLLYGVGTDAQGNIVSPKEIYKDATGGETLLEKTIGGLAPNTVYYVDVQIDPATFACITPINPIRTTFTTKDLLVGSRSKSHQNAPAQLSVQPNPASQTVTVRSSEAGYTGWTLTYSNGVHIRGGKCTADTDLMLDVSTLTPGLYIVTFLGGKNPPVAKTFVVQR